MTDDQEYNVLEGANVTRERRHSQGIPRDPSGGGRAHRSGPSPYFRYGIAPFLPPCRPDSGEPRYGRPATTSGTFRQTWKALPMKWFPHSRSPPAERSV